MTLAEATWSTLHSPRPGCSPGRLAMHLLLGCLAFAPGAASAAPVSIDNPGFEDLYLGSNLPAEYAGDVPTWIFPTGSAPSHWTAYYQGGSPPAGTGLVSCLSVLGARLARPRSYKSAGIGSD